MGPQTKLEVETNNNTEVDFVKRIPIRPTNSKLAEISGSTGTNEPLRLKRAKPLKRDENNLEKSLGIIRKITTL